MAIATTALNQPRRGGPCLPATGGDCGSCVEVCFFICDCIDVAPSNSISEIFLRLSCGPRRQTLEAVQETKESWDKEQRGYGGEKQTANDRTSERCVLFAAVPEPQSHGQHADDHGQRRHQDGAKARESRLE